jgi:4-amino-4-deoxy-L-arabinose transferase-like glycosyltransferase
MPLTGDSVTTAAEASPAIHAKTWLACRPQCLRFLIFTLCAALYLLPFMRLLQLGGDEGSVVYGAVRIVHGQVFARDFFEVMGPGTPYWLAAFFKVFGVTFLATRICLFLTSLGTGILMYFLSCRVCKRYRSLPCLLLVSTFFGASWPGNSHHVDGNFFALLSVACVVLWQDRRWKALLIFAGVFAGLTTCFLQPKGVLLLVAMLLWLWVQRQRGAASISALGLIAGGYLGVAGLVLGYFWSQRALGSLVFANLVWPSRHYGTVNAVPYAQGIIRWYWVRYITMKDAFSWPFNLAAIGVAAILIAPFLFVASLPALMPLSALWAILAGRNKWRPVAPEIALYGLCGSALWLSEMHRVDIFHLVFGSPLLIVLCIYFLDVNRSRFSGYALQLLFITAVSLAAFNFIGVLTAHSLMTRVGSVAVFKDDPVLVFIDTHVAPGEEMFVYPYHPMYYFLSSTTNPTRYSLLLYNYDTETEFYDAINSLGNL